MAFSQTGFHASVTIGQLRASSLEQNREGHEFHSCRFGRVGRGPWREDSVQAWNCPTQAKSGLEWSTRRELILRSLFATPRAGLEHVEGTSATYWQASHRRRSAAHRDDTPPLRHCNHTIVRCAVACTLLVCAWGWGMEDTVALKVTRKNLQRLAEAFANDAADPYRHFHKADVMAHFKMNIEDAWSEGIEVYATEDGFVFSEWGVMSRYKVAAQA
jgi:hypothetical protein